MVNYKTQLNAYSIPLLHAAKYPASDICGVLLGRDSDIITAVPFFHHWTTLTPMLEVALQQTDIYAKKNNLSIIGWYHGNARLEDNTLPEKAIKVAETIKKNNQDKAIIFLINNKEFSELDQDKPVITPYINHENQWRKMKEPFLTKESEISFEENENVYTKVRGYMNSLAYNGIHDFDEHLEDVSINWLNNTL